jgi:hypothetical protein
MTASARPLTKRPAWEALAVHHKKVKGLHLRDLFSADLKRGERLTAEAVGLFLDYSKNRVSVWHDARPCHGYKRSNMARYIVQARKHLVHQVEVYLPQSQRIYAAKIGHSRWRKARPVVSGDHGSQFCE